MTTEVPRDAIVPGLDVDFEFRAATKEILMRKCARLRHLKPGGESIACVKPEHKRKPSYFQPRFVESPSSVELITNQCQRLKLDWRTQPRRHGLDDADVESYMDCLQTLFLVAISFLNSNTTSCLSGVVDEVAARLDRDCTTGSDRMSFASLYKVRRDLLCAAVRAAFAHEHRTLPDTEEVIRAYKLRTAHTTDSTADANVNVVTVVSVDSVGAHVSTVTAAQAVTMNSRLDCPVSR